MNWMRTIFLSAMTFLVMGLSAWAQGGKHFLVESGKIEYTFGGDFSGNEVFYFDGFGSRENHVKNLFSKSGDKNTKTKIIINENSKAETNLETGVSNISIIDFDNSTVKDDTERILEAGHFNKTGTERVAGMLCDNYKGKLGMLSVWKGIVLKSEIVIADKKLSKTAVFVDTLSKIPKDIFLIEQFTIKLYI